MINFDYLEKNKEKLRMDYLLARPFQYLIIDNFCDSAKAETMYSKIPDLDNKSRDYIFAGNKFEKSNYKELGPEFDEFYNEISSPRMNAFLSFIANEEVFVDPKNHGGGLHQGKKNSFLDMHLDFNYHPIHKNWYRNMNLLYYMNKNWNQGFGGHLKLEDLRSGEKKQLDVPFNRLIIQRTSSYTLHGYDMTNFPQGNYRTSIATYAYTPHQMHVEVPRLTDWRPNNNSSWLKKTIAKNMGGIVKLKNRILGSGTAKNQ